MRRLFAALYPKRLNVTAASPPRIAVLDRTPHADQHRDYAAQSNDNLFNPANFMSSFESFEKKMRLGLDVLRAFSVLIGAIVIFFLVQRPETILNESSSKETIARERAKLLLEIIKEDDPKKRKQSLAVIQAAYGNAPWLNDVEKILLLEAKQQSNIQSIQKLSSLIEQRRKLIIKLQREEKGLDGRLPGKGPVYYSLFQELLTLEAGIRSEIEALSKSEFESNTLYELKRVFNLDSFNLRKELHNE